MMFGLSKETIKKISSVFLQYPQIKIVIIYGSRAKGNYKNGSDIDLTIKGSHLDHKLLCKIGNDLDDLLTPYKFDLSLFQDIESKELLEHIERVGQVFYI